MSVFACFIVPALISGNRSQDAIFKHCAGQPIRRHQEHVPLSKGLAGEYQLMRIKLHFESYVRRKAHIDIPNGYWMIGIPSINEGVTFLTRCILSSGTYFLNAAG